MKRSLLISGKWLKSMRFGTIDNEEGTVYYMNGLFITYWRDIGWRWQVGGECNMWEPLHNPTKEFVTFVLQALRGTL